MDFNSEIIQIKEKDRVVEIKRKVDPKTFIAKGAKATLEAHHWSNDTIECF